MPGQRKYAFLGLLAFSICILALYVHRHRQGQTGKIDNALIQSLGFFQKNFSYFIKGSKSVVDHYFWLVNTKKNNEALTSEVESLRTQVTQIKEMELETQRLRELLDFREKTAYKMQGAHVIAQDISSDYVGIRIDKGLRDQVRVGLGVVHPSGVVGRIQRVTEISADVITVIDPTSSVDGFIQRSRARGIVSGQSKQMNCKMKYMDKVEDVAVNDTVLSTGFKDFFPKGLLIGYVTAILPNPNGIMQSITVKPAVDIYRLEEVFVVMSPEDAS